MPRWQNGNAPDWNQAFFKKKPEGKKEPIFSLALMAREKITASAKHVNIKDVYCESK